MGDPAGLAGVLVVLVAFGAVCLAGGAIEWLIERRERGRDAGIRELREGSGRKTHWVRRPVLDGKEVTMEALYAAANAVRAAQGLPAAEGMDR